MRNRIQQENVNVQDQIFSQPDQLKERDDQKYIVNDILKETNSPDKVDRDSNGNIKLYNDVDENQSLYIEPITTVYSQKSINRNIDRSFSYFQFPPNIIITENISEINLDSVINESNVLSSSDDQFEGQILRTSAGYYVIEDNKARKLNTGAATSVFLEKRGVPPFYKTVSGLRLQQDIENVLDDYDVGENIFSVYNNNTYTRVNLAILNSYELGEPISAEEVYPGGNLIELIVNVSWNSIFSTSLPDSILQDFNIQINGPGTEGITVSGVNKRYSLENQRSVFQRKLLIDINTINTGDSLSFSVSPFSIPAGISTYLPSQSIILSIGETNSNLELTGLVSHPLTTTAVSFDIDYNSLISILREKMPSKFNGNLPKHGTIFSGDSALNIEIG